MSNQRLETLLTMLCEGSRLALPQGLEMGKNEVEVVYAVLDSLVELGVDSELDKMDSMRDVLARIATAFEDDGDGMSN